MQGKTDRKKHTERKKGRKQAREEMTLMSRKGGKQAVQGKTDRKFFSLSHRKLHAKYLEEELLSFRTRGLKSLQEAQLPWW